MSQITQTDAANVIAAFQRMLQTDPPPPGEFRDMVDRVVAHMSEQIRKLDADVGDGGPAYPVYDHHGDGSQFLAQVGMSIRDAYAIAITQGLIAQCMGNAARMEPDEAAAVIFRWTEAVMKARAA